MTLEQAIIDRVVAELALVATPTNGPWNTTSVPVDAGFPVEHIRQAPRLLVTDEGIRVFIVEDIGGRDGQTGSRTLVRSKMRLGVRLVVKRDDPYDVVASGRADIIRAVCQRQILADIHGLIDIEFERSERVYDPEHKALGVIDVYFIVEYRFFEDAPGEGAP